MFETCQRLLGFSPIPEHFKKAQLKLRFLREMLQTALPDDASNEQCIQRSRAYILLLFGGVLFTDTSDSSVHMNYLLLLEDLDRFSRLSWGSAVLACLYRNLCKASLFDVNIIAGPLMLL